MPKLYALYIRLLVRCRANPSLQSTAKAKSCDRSSVVLSVESAPAQAGGHSASHERPDGSVLDPVPGAHLRPATHSSHPTSRRSTLSHLSLITLSFSTLLTLRFVCAAFIDSLVRPHWGFDFRFAATTSRRSHPFCHSLLCFVDLLCDRDLLDQPWLMADLLAPFKEELRNASQNIFARRYVCTSSLQRLRDCLTSAHSLCVALNAERAVPFPSEV
jgi:hypothetical protein